MSGRLAAIRRRVLEAALGHVPFDGWSDRTLRLALEDCGFDRATGLRAFPRGASGLLEFFLAEADRCMVEDLARRDLAAMRIRDRVTAGVRLRLEQLSPHREAVRRVVALQSLPPHAPAALQSLYRTVDHIWRAAGDDATDFNFYTKRALLAWVYSTTVLYWLDDDSEGAEDTWAFLERRIDDVMRFGKATGRLRSMVERLMPLPLRATRGRPSPGRST